MTPGRHIASVAADFNPPTAGRTRKKKGPARADPRNRELKFGSGTTWRWGWGADRSAGQLRTLATSLLSGSKGAGEGLLHGKIMTMITAS